MIEFARFPRLPHPRFSARGTSKGFFEHPIITVQAAIFAVQGLPHCVASYAVLSPRRRTLLRETTRPAGATRCVRCVATRRVCRVLEVAPLFDARSNPPAAPSLIRHPPLTTLHPFCHFERRARTNARFYLKYAMFFDFRPLFFRQRDPIRELKALACLNL
jgi:hypothetical protein